MNAETNKITMSICERFFRGRERNGLTLRPDLPEYLAELRRKRMGQRFQRLNFDLQHEDAMRLICELKPHVANGARIDPGACFLKDLELNDPAFKFLVPLLGGTGLLRHNDDLSITVIITEPLLEALEKHSEEAAIKAMQESCDASLKELEAKMNQGAEEILARHRAQHDSEEPKAEPVYQGIRHLGVRQRFFSGRDFPDRTLEFSMIRTLVTGKIGAGSSRKIQEP